MDKALENFGIFDFMGVWGPGAIAVMYFYFTMHGSMEKWLDFFHISPPHISETYRLVILFTAVAYVVGLVLHELGKILVERNNRFKFDTVKGLYNFDEKSAKNIFYYIAEEYKHTTNPTIPAEIYKEMTFDNAVSILKYKDKAETKRIDKCHSIYALSRSLSICFAAHAILELLTAVLQSCSINIPLIILDCILAWLFYVRTYRYLCSWVRNVFMQWYYYS